MKTILYALCLVVCLTSAGCRSGVANQAMEYTPLERNYLPLVVTKIHELNQEIQTADSDAIRASLVKERWDTVRRHIFFEGASGQHILGMAFLSDMQPSHPVVPPISKMMSEVIINKMMGNRSFPSDLTGNYEFEGSTLHVIRDVRGSITAKESTTLVIGGDVLKGSTIETEDFADIYIAGNLEGDLILQSMSNIIVVGDVRGTITINDSRTGLQVYGDFDGVLRAGKDRPSLSIKVNGFTPLSVLQQIMGENFLSIDGYFTRSDAPAGELHRKATIRSLLFKLIVESSTKDLT